MQYIIAPTSDYLEHSAKGSEWKKHKYIKKADGKYYYPISYKGGRHLDTKHKAKMSEWLSNSSKKSKGANNQKPMSSVQRKSDELELKELKDMERTDTINKLSDLTGMKEESFDRLINIANTKGVNSDEYKELCKLLAEGDDDTYDEITKAVRDLGDVKYESGKQREAKKETDSNNEDEDNGEYKLTEKDIDDLAKEALNGDLGDGELRKELLGNWYDDVQKRVNELSSKRKLKHGIEIPAYVIRPSDKMIFW